MTGDAAGTSALGVPDVVHAFLFDLDGVLTDTASVHKRAWKSMFDEFLKNRDGEGYTPFDVDSDYLTYVDGKTRDDGVRSFLASRDIELPEGSPDDDGDQQTVNGLANRKNDLFQTHMHTDGVTVFDGSRRYLQAVADAGLPIAVVSSSANTREVLELTGLDRYVARRVDGVTIREEHLKGKPAPDSYLRGAELLDVAPEHCAVFEDAISGVQAGRDGHFGVVVGVDRLGRAKALHDNGADIVVTDLGDLLAAR
jgi:beta-phosphoglucomutase family hydrolase